ncbi:hypothetical protein AAFF_G00133650 [Aldrovandia affinis]|uniref:Uncharacterized protein n=1 Tax=Aldrovandia affinis TaxID=143900 RepID=A0AAD7RQI8_9TELE|nr:hypothetical protein AAFF_G00133650 [Aldrovandia affinis]
MLKCEDKRTAVRRAELSHLVGWMEDGTSRKCGPQSPFSVPQNVGSLERSPGLRGALMKLWNLASCKQILLGWPAHAKPQHPATVQAFTPTPWKRWRGGEREKWREPGKASWAPMPSAPAQSVTPGVKGQQVADGDERQMMLCCCPPGVTESTLSSEISPALPSARLWRRHKCSPHVRRVRQ